MPSDQIPEAEADIYADLVSVRTQLSEIKHDIKPIDPAEVQQLYTEVLSKINELKAVREAETEDLGPESLPNKVDVLVDEIFQLLSLCFVSCGQSTRAPATYASLTTVQRLLEHLSESGAYTAQDLEPIHERLDEIGQIIQDDESPTTKEEVRLLNSKLAQCKSVYDSLHKKIEDVPEDVQALIDQFLAIKYEMLELQSNKAEGGDFDASQLDSLKKRLDQVQAQAEPVLLSHPAGEQVIKGLLDDCHDTQANLELGEDRIDPHLKETYEELLKLHSILTNLLVTRRWTLRTTDLFNYQRELNEIDKSRVKGGYFGSKDYKGQSVLLYLLRSCFAIIYRLLESSEPVSESLQPIHNQLQTLHRCLLDLKQSGGIDSERELYPYQLKLRSVDNDAPDGIFMVDGQIPAGQGTLTALLAECFDLLHELKIDYYDEHGDDDVIDDEANTKAANVIGTKALQDTGYDYNDLGDQDYDAEDNLADAESYNSDEDEE